MHALESQKRGNNKAESVRQLVTGPITDRLVGAAPVNMYRTRMVNGVSLVRTKAYRALARNVAMISVFARPSGRDGDVEDGGRSLVDLALLTESEDPAIWKKKLARTLPPELARRLPAQSDARYRKIEGWAESAAQRVRDELQSNYMQEWLMELYITRYLRLEEVLKDEVFALAPGLRNAFHHEGADEFSSFVVPKRLGPRVCRVGFGFLSSDDRIARTI